MMYIFCGLTLVQKVFNLKGEFTLEVSQGPGTNQLLTCKEETYHLPRCVERIWQNALLLCSCDFASTWYEFCLNVNLVNVTPKNSTTRISSWMWIESLTRISQSIQMTIWYSSTTYKNNKLKLKVIRSGKTKELDLIFTTKVKLPP
jgi:hypothetical protein